MIEMLHEDILLEIFDFYRLNAIKRSRGRPWQWYPLARVCRRWRYVLTASPSRLGLQIFCKPRAPIEHILDSWPTLPLVIRYKYPKSKSLPDNIISALRRPGRVREIDLVLPWSLMQSTIEMIQEPFQALERIRLTAKNAVTRQPLLASEELLGGSAPRLREIKLDGIAFPFPTIRQLLSSAADNLVQLCLSNIPNTGYFTPDALVTSLSTLTQLMELTIDFNSPNSPPQSMARSPHQRVILPCLSILSYHGASEYINEFVVQVDFPALTYIKIELFNAFIFHIPRFCQFISRANALNSPTEVMLTPSSWLVTLLFIQQGEDRRVSGEFSLGVPCSQHLSMTGILSQLSPILSGVDSISIKPYRIPYGEKGPLEDVDSTQWLDIFRPFTHVKKVHVFERLVPDIVDALTTQDMATGVLPELTHLYLKGYRQSPSVAKAAAQFVAARRHSGRTISLFN